MAKAGRRATVALATAVTMILTGSASAQDASTTPTAREAIVVLRVINYAALSRSVLDGARARVAGVYDAIGVHTEWVDSDEAVLQRREGRLNLTVLLLSRDMAESKISAEGIRDGVLGQAHADSGRAHIFCARIAASARRPVYFAIPLGDVIAHEVGHLLLGTNSHGPIGIMRASVNVQDTHLRSFTRTQAIVIRASLHEQAAPTLVRHEEADSRR